MLLLYKLLAVCILVLTDYCKVSLARLFAIVQQREYTNTQATVACNKVQAEVYLTQLTIVRIYAIVSIAYVCSDPDLPRCVYTHCAVL
jgi:hypothetical protein